MQGFVLSPEEHCNNSFRMSALTGALRAARGRKEINGEAFIITQAEEEG